MSVLIGMTCILAMYMLSLTDIILLWLWLLSPATAAVAGNEPAVLPSPNPTATKQSLRLPSQPMLKKVCKFGLTMNQNRKCLHCGVNSTNILLKCKPCVTQLRNLLFFLY